MKASGFALLIGVCLLSSCEKKIEGCTDATASNYNEDANTDDGSCTYKYYGKAVFWYNQATMNQFNSSGATSIQLYIDGALTFTYFVPLSTYEAVEPDCSVNTATSLVKNFEVNTEFGQSFVYELKKDDGTVLQSLPFFVIANSCTPVELFY